VGIRDDVLVDVGVLVIELYAGRDLVVHAAGVERAGEIGLVGRRLRRRRARLRRAVDVAVGQEIAGTVVGVGPDVVVRAPAVARRVAERPAVREIVRDRDRADVGLGLAEVAAE